jgi:hypothetical protein
MELCPVCETPQPPGTLECPTCGRERPAPPGVDAFPKLAELEPTLADPSLAVTVETVDGLEPSAQPIGEVPVERVPDLEGHMQAPVAAEGLEPMPDLEPTLAEEVPAIAATPGPLRCRYCGAEGQQRGLFCDRCGMRLARPVVSLDPVPVVEEGEGRSCRACGARRFAHGLCIDCGTPLPPS